MSIPPVSSQPPSDPNQTTTSTNSDSTDTISSESSTTESSTTSSSKSQKEVDNFLSNPLIEANISDEDKKTIENDPDKFSKMEEASISCMKKSKSNLDEENENTQKEIKSYDSQTEDPTLTTKQKSGGSSSGSNNSIS